MWQISWTTGKAISRQCILGFFFEREGLLCLSYLYELSLRVVVLAFPSYKVSISLFLKSFSQCLVHFQ